MIDNKLQIPVGFRNILPKECNIKNEILKYIKKILIENFSNRFLYKCDVNFLAINKIFNKIKDRYIEKNLHFIASTKNLIPPLQSI